ncbi:hypothetical protein EQV77_13330 [Halobacillus fulvus]|nr:hypothetical protein EQV77_13330 [Halobacillus fulvus]
MDSKWHKLEAYLVGAQIFFGGLILSFDVMGILNTPIIYGFFVLLGFLPIALMIVVYKRTGTISYVNIGTIIVILILFFIFITR